MPAAAMRDRPEWRRWNLHRTDGCRETLGFASFAPLPFSPKRHFVVTGLEIRTGERGGHAARESRTLLQCLAGSCRLHLDDGTRKEIVELNSVAGGQCVEIGPLVWIELETAPGAVVLGLCSLEEADQVCDYDAFLREATKERPPMEALPLAITDGRATLDKGSHSTPTAATSPTEPGDKPGGALACFIHERAIVDPGAKVGAGTRVWANAHIQRGAIVGDNCNIGEGAFIESGAIVGDNCTVKNGVAVYEGTTLEDGVFVATGTCFCNDPFPRSGAHKAPVPIRVRRGASLGANCTILPGMTIGEGAMVGAGSTVVRDVETATVVVGSPAVFLRRI
ncbi:trimeric LpxA-like protein [Hyaloraphidium curvatum]|nr:trimeric LpxA-like protein [Hyaloraphidium curvatum]